MRNIILTIINLILSALLLTLILSMDNPYGVIPGLLVICLLYNILYRTARLISIVYKYQTNEKRIEDDFYPEEPNRITKPTRL